LASYIDVVNRDPSRFASFKIHERWARELVSALRTLDLHQGRADAVVRTAVAEHGSGFGLTLYASGCGADYKAALAAWKRILAATVAATIAAASHHPYAGE